MANTIKLRRSATSGATPTTSQLALGEVAMNTYDGKLFLKTDQSGTEAIVEVGSDASAIVSGTLAVDRGGSGQTSYTNGQLLIGNSTGNTLSKATLTAGSGVSITNGNGSIEISATGAGGTVTSVNVAGGTGLSSSGGPVTGSGTITLDLDDTAVTAGSYTAADITIDAQGRITAAASGTIDTAEIADDAVTAAKLADTSVTAGSYTAADITIDAQGRITAAANGAISTSEITDSAVTTAKINDDAVTAAKLADTSVTAGSYTAADITVDAQGRITAASSGTVSTGEIADSAVTTAKINDDAVTAAKLADTSVTAGSYTLSSITVDAQGRITAASSGTAGSADKITEGNTEAEVVDTGSNGHFKITTEGVERIRVGPAGQIGIAGANYGTSGQLLSSGGSSGVVAWVDPIIVVDGGNFATGGSLATSSTAINGGLFN